MMYFWHAVELVPMLDKDSETPLSYFIGIRKCRVVLEQCLCIQKATPMNVWQSQFSCWPPFFFFYLLFIFFIITIIISMFLCVSFRINIEISQRKQTLESRPKPLLQWLIKKSDSKENWKKPTFWVAHLHAASPNLYLADLINLFNFRRMPSHIDWINQNINNSTMWLRYNDLGIFGNWIWYSTS